MGGFLLGDHVCYLLPALCLRSAGVPVAQEVGSLHSGQDRVRVNCCCLCLRVIILRKALIIGSTLPPLERLVVVAVGCRAAPHVGPDTGSL